MLGNTFGRIFQITTCGESYGWRVDEHGQGWGGSLLTIVNGVPPGIKVDLGMIQHELDKRRPGQSKLDSPRKETDRVEIVSGLQEGLTTGAPVGLVIRNVDTQDVHVEQYRQVKDVIRPGHAELNFFYKYGQHGDWCGAGRSSGRETVGRVAGGAVAKQILARESVEILAHVIESCGIRGRSISEGTMTFEEMKANYRKNDLNCCDLDAAPRMIEDLLKIRAEGDTAGGAIEIVARGVPAGLGEPVFDKLKATIAHALCSIGAMTALEFGAGWEAARSLGSQWNDQPFVDSGHVRFRTNKAGGFLGGMSNGEDLLMRVAVKPTPTISKEQDTVDMTTLEAKKLEAITRRDISLLPRWYPVAEAMVACAVLDALYLSKAWHGLAHLDEKWRQLTEPRHKGDYTK
jgi:chorismate synthase